MFHFFAEATEKDKNTAFDTYVQAQVKNGMSQQEAEVITAASAGGVVPTFTKSLQNRLASPNPDVADSAAQQIHTLNEMNSGNALRGLTKEDRAMYHSMEAIRDSLDPVKALQDAHDIIYNKDEDVLNASQNKWVKWKENQKPTALSDDEFGISLARLDDAKFLTVGDKTVYGNDLLQEYKTYYMTTGGNTITAQKMLDESVKNNYGTTYINGMEQTTKHPIEKVLNIPQNSIGVVQEDISNQLKTKFDEAKKLYDSNDKGRPNEYWTLVPRSTASGILSVREKNAKDLKSGEMSHWIPRSAGQSDKYDSGAPIEVIRHFRNGTPKRYTVVIKANPFARTTNNPDSPVSGGWDIAVNSGEGISNIYREAPYLGIITYSPDVKFIRSTYTKLHPMQ